MKLNFLKTGNLFLTGLFMLFALASSAQHEENYANSLLYFTGTLGPEEKIEFNMQITGYRVSGSYIIESKGDLYTFSGRLTPDKSGIAIIVFNEGDLYVASVDATLRSEEANFAKEINGKWKSTDGKTIQKLHLRKIAELASITPLQSRPGCPNRLSD